MAANPQMLIRIAANLDQLRKNLAEGKSQIEATTSGMQKLAASLDGSKLEQRAHNITAAINQVGGATVLTDAEAKRHLVTIDAWIAKANRLGKEIPADILKTRDALVRVDDAQKSAVTSGTNWMGMLTKIGGAVGIAFSVGAVKNFIGSVFDAASEVHDIALKLGVSTDAAQGFKFAAEQSGSSLDAVSTALNKMNSNLAEGDKSTVKALKDAGLGFDAIRGMKPEDAFLAITDAIQKIPDPMIQSDVALKLFGKSAAELLPAIKEGFRGAAEGASKMSAETIRDLEAAQDTWARVGNQMTIVSGGVIAGLMRIPAAVKEVGSSFTLLQAFLGDAALTGLPNAIARLTQLTKETGKYKDTNLALIPTIHKTAEQLAAEEAALKKATAAAKQHADAIQQITDKYSGANLAKQVKDLSEAMKGLGANANFKLLAEDIGKLFQQGAKLTPEMMRLALAFGQIGPAVDNSALNVKNFGSQIAVTIPQVDAYGQALARIAALPSFGNVGALGGFNVGKPDLQAVLDMVKADEDWANSLGMVAHAFDQLASSSSGSMSRILSSIAGITGALQQAMSITTKAGGKGTGGILTPMFDADATGAEKWSAGISGGVTVAAGAMSVWNDTASAGTKSAGALTGAMSGAKAGAAFGPYGMAIGAVAGAVVGMIHAMSAGRREVENFAKSFDTAAAGTGFDELQKKMLTLGDDYERLWKKLTQETKKGDKAGAQKVIAEIQAALANTPEALAAAAGFQTTAQLQAVADKAKKVYDFMVSSGQYSASEIAKAFAASTDAQKALLGENAKAQQEALDAISAKYSESISKLESEYKSLSDSVAGEAEEEFMGVVEMQQRERMKQIEAEKNAQEIMRDAEIAAKTETFDQVLEAGKKAHTDIQDYYNQNKLGIPFRFVHDGGAPGGGTGYVPSGVPTYSGGGGDSAFRAGGSGSSVVAGGGDQHITLVMPDGDVLLRQVVKSGKRKGWM